MEGGDSLERLLNLELKTFELFLMSTVVVKMFTQIVNMSLKENKAKKGG